MSMKLFVSYSREDFDFVKDIIAELKETPHIDDIWWDEEQIMAGDRWKKVIEKKLLTTDLLLFVVSRSSLLSPNCQFEYKTYLENHKILVPIYLYHTPEIYLNGSILGIDTPRTEVVDPLSIPEYFPYVMLDEFAQTHSLPRNKRKEGLLPYREWENRSKAAQAIKKDVIKKIRSETKDINRIKNKRQEEDNRLSERVFRSTHPKNGDPKPNDDENLYNNVLKEYLSNFGINMTDLEQKELNDRTLYHYYAPQKIAFEPISNAFGEINVLKRRIADSYHYLKQFDFRVFLIPYDFLSLNKNELISPQIIETLREEVSSKLDAVDGIIRSFDLNGRLHIARIDKINFEKIIHPNN